MGIIIKPLYKSKDIDSFLKRETERIERRVMHRLQELGRLCVKDARESGDYKDISGNLRSSIGYLVVKGSEIISKGGFSATKNSGYDGEEGALEGLNYALSLASKRGGKSLSVIVVAGMHYTSYVTSKK